MKRVVDKLNWGLLATSAIAGTFVRGLAQSQTGIAYAVASRSLDKAKNFAKEHGLPTAYGSYEELLADSKVDVVYISTPHAMHAEWSVKAAEAGKHILCEKPIALDYDEAVAVIEAASRNDVFFMEAFMYRCNPQTAKLLELIREGAIGDVQMIRATFGGAIADPESYLFNPALGGGAVLGVGCYAISMVRLIAGAILGMNVAEPIDVCGTGHVGDESGVDEWAAATLRFEGGIIAQVSTSIRSALDNKVLVFGRTGCIEVQSPWFCQGTRAGESTIIVRIAGRDDQTMKIAATRGVYAFEADTVARYIASRQALSPAMNWADSLGNMKTLDRWRASFSSVKSLQIADVIAHE